MTRRPGRQVPPLPVMPAKAGSRGSREVFAALGSGRNDESGDPAQFFVAKS
jgi:hypothetical protein